MPANKELHLTDEQYRRILIKIKETVDKPDFQPKCFDSTTTGAKYTESNCGFCNEDFVEKDMALFPEQFPERKTMKYRNKEHKCPFDMRKELDVLGWGNGCFYKCYLFNNKTYDILLIREMVRRQLNDN